MLHFPNCPNLPDGNTDSPEHVQFDAWLARAYPTRESCPNCKQHREVPCKRCKRPMVGRIGSYQVCDPCADRMTDSQIQNTPRVRA